tara:strand:+ start:105 stop:551 length:447 start_codon:yes stop_codon:yes gene_type:complete
MYDPAELAVFCRFNFVTEPNYNTSNNRIGIRIWGPWKFIIILIAQSRTKRWNYFEKTVSSLNIIYYLEEPPSPALLGELLKKLGLTARDILRKKEDAYSLHNLEKSGLDEESILEIMSSNPILIERPIVVKDSKAVLGRPPENVLELI